MEKSTILKGIFIFSYEPPITGAVYTSQGLRYSKRLEKATSFPKSNFQIHSSSLDNIAGWKMDPD